MTEKKLGNKFSQDYLLLKASADVLRSGAGRSEILECVSTIAISTTTAVPQQSLILKIVKEDDRFEREKNNYNTICGKSKLSKDAPFVNIIKFEKGVKSGTNVIVMEKGAIDLKKACAKAGPVRGEAFVRIAKAMAAALEKIHAKGLVWTDLKLDNFVLLSDVEGSTDYFGTSAGKFVCKAIDLESAVKEKTKLVDFSPEMIAPEQVEILQGGSISSVGNRGKDLFLSVDEPLLAYKEADIWALGIAMLHLYQGKAPITNQVSNVKAAVDKVSRYAEGTTDFGLKDVKEPSLRILLQSMLNADKKKRPNVTSVQIALNFIA